MDDDEYVWVEGPFKNNPPALNHKLKSFEENVNALDQIVNQLETGDLNLSDALEAFEKALAIAKKVKQPVWGVPWIMDNISQLYEAWGKYDKALEYSKKTDKAYQDLFGGTGRKPDVVGNIKERLGNCMSELGDQEGARTYMHEALLKFEQAHGGKNHPDLADLFNKMAKTYVRDGDFKRAMTYYHKSISTNNSEFSGNTIDFESSEVRNYSTFSIFFP